MSKTVYLSREEFDLQKVKITKDDMKVNFVEVRNSSEGVVKIPHSMEPPFVVHPDLRNVLNKMKKYVLKQYDYHKPFELEVSSKAKEALDTEWDALCSKVTVTGFTVTGADQLKSAIITAKIKTESGTRALPTGRIVYSSDKLGYEKDVQELVSLATDEVYACLFESKRAQLDLFDEDGVKEHPAKKGKGQLVAEAAS